MILGATLSQKIIEFASDGASFFLSKHTDGNEVSIENAIFIYSLWYFALCEL